MRRTLVLAAVVLALALMGASPVMAQSSDESGVAKAVEAFRNAALKADRSQFEALTADQLSYGHSAGRVENKTQFIDNATSGQSRWKFITLTDQTINIVGTTAIVRHTFTGESERDGKTNPVKLGVLTVWQKQDGNWKLLARQAVRLEAPQTN
jgi:ketosteroid isomerase-like protein